MRFNKLVFVSLLLVAATLGGAQLSERPYALMAGDQAPSLNVGKWLKGSPVKEFEKGKTYVVEFWATWCGPCKKSIPHLTELQKAYPEVQFIGISIWENQQSDVEPFVNQMGDKMGYSIAMDQVASTGTHGVDGEMAKSWMSAAGPSGIPSAFIVSDGRIVWIGNPTLMDKPLSQVVSGKWDATAFAKLYAIRKTREKAMEVIQDRMDAAVKKKDWNALHAAMKEAFDGPAHDSDQLLNDLVSIEIMPNSPVAEPDLSLMQLIVERAVELNHRKDYATLDTLARIYFLQGDKSKAEATEREAIYVAPADQKINLIRVLKRYAG